MATTTHFTPSSNDLMDMIRRAEAKCDADVEQSRLRKEAREEARMVRALTAEAEARGRRLRWGC